MSAETAAGESKVGLLEEIEQHKNEGNELFKEQKYADARRCYTQAAERYERADEAERAAVDAAKLGRAMAIVYSNRAQTAVKLEEAGSAKQDADLAIAADARYAKGYYRRAVAMVMMGKYKEAMQDYKKVTQLAPNDATARRNLAECKKLVHRIAFAAAIHVDEEPVSAVVLREMAEPGTRYSAPEPTADYKGPRPGSSSSSAAAEGSKEAKEEEEFRITLDQVHEMVEWFRGEKRLHAHYVARIALAMLKVLKALPSLVRVEVPAGERITVCGDVHGQFYDLLHIFELNGEPSEHNPYVFNGDFVDRGSFSAEVVLTLFAYKLLYPQHVHLARGNHESVEMNKMYGFDGEITAKYGDKMRDLFAEVFCALPLAHVLNGRVFVVHGGIPSEPEPLTLAQVEAVNRFCQPPESGTLHDLLWSDPQDEPGRRPSRRGTGYSFGPEYTRAVLERNGLSLLLRSHEVKPEGYEIAHGGLLATVFSAPNYCDQMGNKGAFATFVAPDMKPTYTSFDAVPHPDIKPMAYSSGLGGMFGF